MLATIFLAAISIGAGAGIGIARLALPTPRYDLEREHTRLLAVGWKHDGNGGYSK